MVVLREPGEVYALRHSFGRRMLEDEVTAWVERIDPRTLGVLERSPELSAGPVWPGGLAAHANGSLICVFGRWCHRLAPDCTVLARRELPQPRPYNSFVILGDGTIATKDFDRTLTHRARLSLLDPETLEPRCAEVELPESVIARLSCDRNTLYVVGATTVHRYVWDGKVLERDAGWSLRYLDRPDQSYGWDPVIEGDQLWFLDNGEHTYTTSMLDAGVAGGPVRLARVALADAADHDLVEVSGSPRGAVTDPPLYDPDRQIALGYDSANAELAAWRLTRGGLERLWQRRLGHAAHMIRYPATGEVVVGDFHDGFPRMRSPRLRALATRGGGLATNARFRAFAARRSREDVVVLDIETGAEKARATVPSMFQSVLFPAPGWERDFYWCTFSALARVSVA
jgi:hypothetical protein